MRRKIDTRRLLAGGTLIFFGVCILCGGDFGLLEYGKVKFHKALWKQTEEMYLPGLSYGGKEKAKPEEKIVKKAFRLIPLGGYIDEKAVYTSEAEDEFTNELILARQAIDESGVDEKKSGKPHETPKSTIDMSMEKLKKFDYLLKHFYTVDSSTFVNPEDLQAEKLLGTDMKIDKTKEGPKVLIYHTHSQEAFKDSVKGDVNTTIVGMGRILTRLLNEKYGIETMHHEGIYDMENGYVERGKAYERAKPSIGKILKENPSIELVIDLHRDGVREDTHLVTEINGKPTAKVMFFNGMSRTRSNGKVRVLENPYIQENLALSLQMKLAAERLYPGFTRNIYLKGYRYNMHFKPKNMLVECGAQTNTVEELRNAMELLAEIINEVVG